MVIGILNLLCDMFLISLAVSSARACPRFLVLYLVPRACMVYHVLFNWLLCIVNSSRRAQA